MLYRRFGRTELMLPVLTCGGMRFQHSWRATDRVTRASQQNLESCVRRAFELGIHHFETARGYGTSEAQLGKALHKLPRAEILLQTKVSPTADPAEFASHFEESLERLGTDYLDLFALHGLNDEETLRWALRKRGCLELALRWKREGRVRHVGFSTHGPLDVVLAAIRDGRFDYTNLHYFYVQQDYLSAVEEAGQRDLGVFIISPTNKGGKLDEPPPKLTKLTAPLSPMAYNDLFCLSRPEIHTLSIGVKRPSDFDEHVAAVRRLERGAAQVARTVATITRRLDSEYLRVLGQQWARRWREGLPAAEAVPGQIAVREILRLYNLARAFDLTEYGRMRYNLLGQGGHWFPGNRADNIERATLRRALSRSPYPSRVVDALVEAHALFAGAPVERLQQE
jgi:uncharacterized protein